MDRIGPAGGAPTVALSNGQQGFVDENLSVGQTGTSVVAEWLNVLQEEMMTLLASASIAPDVTNFGQILQSIVALIGSSSAGYAGASGFGYFKVLGPVPLTVVFGNGIFPNASVTEMQVLLPVAFPNTFLSGVVTDIGGAGYNFGMRAGADNSHVTVDCPLIQLLAGGVGNRTSATFNFMAIGR